MLYIVLPYKDRNGKYKCALENFLQPFIKYLDGFSNKYEIIIVEQLGGSISNTLPNYYESLVSSLQIKDDEFFNLGRTINIGYDILKDKISENDIFMFHPVDLLPIDVNYFVNKTTKFCFKEHSPDGRYYKSIVFKSTDFEQVNGFSNKYWGWGLEDDDMFIRIQSKNINYDTKINNYHRLSSDGNGLDGINHFAPLYTSNQRFIYEIQSSRDPFISGLNDLSYKLISIEKYNNINKYIIE